MKRKNYLLPYPFQLVGWALLGASVLFILLHLTGCLRMMLPAEWFNTGLSRYLNLALNFMLFPGIFFIALSREKDEDEMIHELRAGSIAATAYIMVVIFIVMTLLNSFGHVYRFFSPVYYDSYVWLTNILMGLLMYLVIYKIRLCKVRWETRKSMKEDM